MSGGFVFAGMTQDELNRQYDQRTLVPDTAPLFELWRSASEAAAKLLGAPEQVSYGDRQEQFADFFPARAPVKGLHIHYHGGAWKSLESRDVWWLAAPWLAAGYHFAAVNFGLVRQLTLLDQVRDAALALRRLPDALAVNTELGPDLVVSGHSSGAHLAAMSALTPFDGGRDDSRKPKHVILASGLYDLEPVRLSSRNSYLNLDRDTARELSPIHCLAVRDAQITLLWSRNELREFRRQSWGMASALQEQNAELCAIQSDAPTHFDTWLEIVPSLVDERRDTPDLPAATSHANGIG